MSNPRKIPIEIYKKPMEVTSEKAITETTFSKDEKMRIETGIYFAALAKGYDFPSILKNKQ